MVYNHQKGLSRAVARFPVELTGFPVEQRQIPVELTGFSVEQRRIPVEQCRIAVELFDSPVELLPDCR
jgi:hypothetical protein